MFHPKRFRGGKLGALLLRNLVLRITAELHRHGERAGHAAAVGRIQLAQLVKQHAHGPPVAGEVVRHQDQQMMPGREPDDLRAQQRAIDQIELVSNFPVHEVGHARCMIAFVQIRKIDQGHIHAGRAGNSLRVSGGTECGPQGFMTLDELLRCAAHRFQLERAAQVQRARFVVSRGDRCSHLGGKPDFALCLGEGEAPHLRRSCLNPLCARTCGGRFNIFRGAGRRRTVPLSRH